MDKKEYGLVLSGGGTKGAYQVGVWKALKELDINIKAIAGASIGAINAALILQNDIKKIESLYKNLELTDILKINSKMDENKDIFDMKNIFRVNESAIIIAHLQDGCQQCSCKYIPRCHSHI